MFFFRMDLSFLMVRYILYMTKMEKKAVDFDFVYKILSKVYKIMKYSIEQLRKRSSVRVKNGDSILGGCDFDGYPRHHFFFNALSAQRYPLSVRVAGLDTWKKGAFRYRVNSDTFSIELVTQGEFLIETDGQRWSVKEGSLFFVPLHRDSAMMCTTEFAEKFTVILRGALLESLLSMLQLDTCTVLQLRSFTEIEKAMHRIGMLLKQGRENSVREANIEAYSLLIRLSEERNDPLPEMMQKLLDIIHFKLHRMYSIADLSSASGLSSATIHRMFLQHCGCTPLTYMTKCRMMSAEEMLSGGERSIKEIASLLGYRNQLYFSSVFRKYHGVSPSDFRMRKRTKAELHS